MKRLKKIMIVSHIILYIWSFVIICIEGLFILLNSYGQTVIYELNIVMFMYIMVAIILLWTTSISFVWLFKKYKK